MKESFNNDSNAPSYSTLRAAVGLFFVAVLVVFALLMVLGVIIESTEHNGAGYALALFSLVVAALAALGLSRCYRDVAALLGKSHWLPAAKRSGAATSSKGRSRSRSGKAQQKGRDTRSPAQAKAARQEPAVQAASRERFVTAKGEEPFIGGLSASSSSDAGLPRDNNTQHVARSQDAAQIEPSLDTGAAAAARDAEDAAVRHPAPATPISAAPRDEPVISTGIEADSPQDTSSLAVAGKAPHEEEGQDWVQRIADDENVSSHRHTEIVNEPALNKEPSTPTAAREKPRVRVVAGGKIDT